MKRVPYFAFLGLLFLLIGCDAAPQVEYMPTTPEERTAVKVEVDNRTAQAIPYMLTGMNSSERYHLTQSFQEQACRNNCRPTQWEYTGSVDGAVKTGRWRYLGEAQWRNEALR